MLEHLPHGIGVALRRVRPGLHSIVSARADIASAPRSIQLTSSAFADCEPLPRYCTADATPAGSAISPPLAWSNVPRDTRALVLVVEDADSPTPLPLVHAIAWGMDPTLTGLRERAIVDGTDGLPLGHHSMFGAGWLPPDPPPGHGAHRYAFQLFAVATSADLGQHPGRRSIVAALRNHVLARGLLIGTYERP